MSQRSQYPKAAFFDLDGTLAVHNNPPAAEDVEAIRKFRAMGNKVFLNTGRSPAFLYSSVLEIGFDGVIAGAGAHIQIGHTTIYRRFVLPEVLDRVIRYFSRRGALCILEGEVGMYQAGPSGDQPYHWPEVGSYEEFARRFPGQAVTKLTFFVPMNEELGRILDGNLSIIQHGDYVEAVPPGCSKSDGMRRVLETLGIDRRDSIAFGDSMNDYDMIQYAGIGVAMGNAVEQVKAAADRITLPFDRGGVAHVLCEIMEKQPNDKGIRGEG